MESLILWDAVYLNYHILESSTLSTVSYRARITWSWNRQKESKRAVFPDFSHLPNGKPIQTPCYKESNHVEVNGLLKCGRPFVLPGDQDHNEGRFDFDLVHNASSDNQYFWQKVMLYGKLPHMSINCRTRSVAERKSLHRLKGRLQGWLNRLPLVQGDWAEE